MQIIDLSASELKNISLLPPLFTRESKTNHVNKIKSSIQKHGVLRDIVVAKLPFIGNELYTIDGQSLVQACLELNLGLSAKVVEINDMRHLVELMSTVNSAAKNWTTLNYIDAWATVKIPDYVYLKKVQEDSGISSSALIYFYTNFTRYSIIKEQILDGKLTIDRDRGDKMMDAFSKYVDCGLSFNNSSAIGLARIMRKIGLDGFDDRLCEIIRENLSIYSQRLSLMEISFYFSIHTKNKF